MNTVGCWNTSNNLSLGSSSLDLCFCFKKLLSCGGIVYEISAVSPSSAEISPESPTGKGVTGACYVWLALLGICQHVCHLSLGQWRVRMAHLAYWWQGNWSFSLIQSMIFLVQLTSLSERFHVEVSLTASNLLHQETFWSRWFWWEESQKYCKWSYKHISFYTSDLVHDLVLSPLPPPASISYALMHSLATVSSPRNSQGCSRRPPGVVCVQGVCSLPGVPWQAGLLLQRQVRRHCCPCTQRSGISLPQQQWL